MYKPFFRETMEKEAVHDRLSADVIQFCKDHIPYADSLSVHGNIVIIADNYTVLTFFSKKVEKEKGKPNPSNAEATFIQSTIKQIFLKTI